MLKTCFKLIINLMYSSPYKGDDKKVNRLESVNSILETKENELSIEACLHLFENTFLENSGNNSKHLLKLIDLIKSTDEIDTTPFKNDHFLECLQKAINQSNTFVTSEICVLSIRLIETDSSWLKYFYLMSKECFNAFIRTFCNTYDENLITPMIKIIKYYTKSEIEMFTEGVEMIYEQMAKKFYSLTQQSSQEAAADLIFTMIEKEPLDALYSGSCIDSFYHSKYNSVQSIAFDIIILLFERNDYKSLTLKPMFEAEDILKNEQNIFQYYKRIYKPFRKIWKGNHPQIIAKALRLISILEEHEIYFSKDKLFSIIDFLDEKRFNCSFETLHALANALILSLPEAELFTNEQTEDIISRLIGFIEKGADFSSKLDSIRMVEKITLKSTILQRSLLPIDVLIPLIAQFFEISDIAQCCVSILENIAEAYRSSEDQEKFYTLLVEMPHPSDIDPQIEEKVENLINSFSQSD